MISQMILFLLYNWNCKIVFLQGNFNTDLLKHEISYSVNDFIDTLSSNFLLPYFLPTRISKTSNLIDNFFSNSISLEEIESVNVTSAFSDHLPQFIFLPDFFQKFQ